MYPPTPSASYDSIRFACMLTSRTRFTAFTSRSTPPPARLGFNPQSGVCIFIYVRIREEYMHNCIIEHSVYDEHYKCTNGENGAKKTQKKSAPLLLILLMSCLFAGFTPYQYFFYPLFVRGDGRGLKKMDVLCERDWANLVFDGIYQSSPLALRPPSPHIPTGPYYMRIFMNTYLYIYKQTHHPLLMNV